MDDKKDVIDNGENQATDNMNYSFDFANQVDTNADFVMPEVNPVTPESDETPATDNVDATLTAENVTSEVSNTVDVTPDLNTQEVASTVEDVIPENDVTAEAVTEQPVIEDMNADNIPVMPEANPVTPEVNAEENHSEEDSTELIKDKQATKRFLIVLFVVLLVFIIALPFIFSVAG